MAAALRQSGSGAAARDGAAGLAARWPLRAFRATPHRHAAGALPHAADQAEGGIQGLGRGGRDPITRLLLQDCAHPVIAFDPMLAPSPFQVGDINTQLLQCLLSDWGLMSELAQLRNFYLLASPTMKVSLTPCLPPIYNQPGNLPQCHPGRAGYLCFISRPDLPPPVLLAPPSAGVGGYTAFLSAEGQDAGGVPRVRAGDDDAGVEGAMTTGCRHSRE